MIGYTRVNIVSGQDICAKVNTVCQDIADSLDNGDRIGATDFSKAFVTRRRLLTKIANLGMDSKIVVWIREFLLGRMQNQGRRTIIREVRVTSDVPQGSVFLRNVNDIWRNTEPTIRLFADN